MTPNFFYISDIANSPSFNGKIFRKKSMLEKFRANFLKMWEMPVSAWAKIVIKLIKIQSGFQSTQRSDWYWPKRNCKIPLYTPKSRRKVSRQRTKHNDQSHGCLCGTHCLCPEKTPGRLGRETLDCGQTH